MALDVLSRDVLSYIQIPVKSDQTSVLWIV